MELKNCLGIILKRRRILLHSLIVIVGIALMFSFTMTPIYKVSSRVLINPNSIESAYVSQEQNFQLPRTLGNLSYIEERNVIDTYLALIANSSIPGKAINELDLRDKKGKCIEAKDFVITFNKYPKLFTSQNKGISIKRIKAAEILEISGYSTNREEAARIADVTTNLFSDFISDLWRKEASLARQSIEKKLTEIELSVFVSEMWRKESLSIVEQEEKLNTVSGGKASAYKETDAQFNDRERSVVLDNQVSSFISEIAQLEIEINNINKSLQKAESELKDFQEGLKKHPDYSKYISSLYNSSAFLENKNELLDLRLKLKSLSGGSKIEYPAVKAVNAKIQNMENTIKRQIDKTFSGIPRTSWELKPDKQYRDRIVETLVNAELNIINLTAQSKVSSDNLQNKNLKLRDLLKRGKESKHLMSRLQTYGEIYDNLKNRLEYVKIAESLDIKNIITIQQAVLSIYPRNDVFFPKKSLILVMALFMSMGFGLTLCFLLEYFDDKIRTLADIKKKLNMPVLGIIPELEVEHLKNIEIEKKPDFDGPFWALRSNIKMAISNKNNKIICVTSALKTEGKTTIIKGLALTLIESGEKVLLIDLNFRRPRLNEIFGLSSDIGLSNYFEGKKTIEKITFSPKIGGLEVIPSGQINAHPLKFIDSPAMAKLIRDYKEKYDYILLDAPAVEDDSDAEVIASFSDQVLFIVSSGLAREECVKNALDAVRIANSNILGIVLNKG